MGIGDFSMIPRRPSISTFSAAASKNHALCNGSSDPIDSDTDADGIRIQTSRQSAAVEDSHTDSSSRDTGRNATIGFGSKYRQPSLEGGSSGVSNADIWGPEIFRWSSDSSLADAFQGGTTSRRPGAEISRWSPTRHWQKLHKAMTLPNVLETKSVKSQSTAHRIVYLNSQKTETLKSPALSTTKADLNFA